MTRCPHCGYEFRNLTLRVDCPKCKEYLVTEKDRSSDDVMNPVNPFGLTNPLNPAHSYTQSLISESSVSTSSDTGTDAGSGGDGGGGGGTD